MVGRELKVVVQKHRAAFRHHHGEQEKKNYVPPPTSTNKQLLRQKVQAHLTNVFEITISMYFCHMMHIGIQGEYYISTLFCFTSKSTSGATSDNYLIVTPLFEALEPKWAQAMLMTRRIKKKPPSYPFLWMNINYYLFLVVYAYSTTEGIFCWRAI